MKIITCKCKKVHGFPHPKKNDCYDEKLPKKIRNGLVASYNHIAKIAKEMMREELIQRFRIKRDIRSLSTRRRGK